ncbi:MAG TPA: hypothetical protein VLU95_07705 [Candidatus Acidoferrum sp.]|nr:hypothetical protein [Candidatus Acidoferrum sp.]
MEVTVNIDENTLAILKTHSDKDLTSIVTEALSNWTNQNIAKCPIDKKYCTSKEPCNNCCKAKNILIQ